MKTVLIFLIVIVFVVCPPPNIEEIKQRRENRRKQFQKDMSECLLKNEISEELKKKLQDNKEEDLRATLHLFMGKLESNDKEIIRKCRREIFRKFKEEHMARFNEMRNRTGVDFPEKMKERMHERMHDRMDEKMHEKMHEK